MGSSYLGPEHILMALGLNPDSGAGRMLGGRMQPPPQAAPSATPTLDQYGIDLTRLASDGKVDPVVGRADEIEQTIEVLSRRTRNNPVLIGEAGVGKTAIVEGIAQRIVDSDVDTELSAMLLRGSLTAGDTVVVDAANDELTFKVEARVH